MEKLTRKKALWTSKSYTFAHKILKDFVKENKLEGFYEKQIAVTCGCGETNGTGFMPDNGGYIYVTICESCGDNNRKRDEYITII